MVRSVKYFTATGSYLGGWSTGDGLSIAAASNGNVYVAEAGRGSVQYFTPTGSRLGTWVLVPKEGENYMEPEGIVEGPDGYIYISDRMDNRVQFFTKAGSFVRKLGTSGTGNGEFVSPSGLGCSANGGRLYVADVWNDRIQYFQ